MDRCESCGRFCPFTIPVRGLSWTDPEWWGPCCSIAETGITATSHDRSTASKSRVVQSCQ